jgi:hypothetical protein
VIEILPVGENVVNPASLLKSLKFSGEFIVATPSEKSTDRFSPKLIVAAVPEKTSSSLIPIPEESDVLYPTHALPFQI